MNKQEIFNKVAKHLLIQNRKSVTAAREGNTICRYRGDNNTSCSIGGLIPDSKYNPEMEDVGRVSTVEKLLQLRLNEVGIQATSESVDFLSRLQDVHDMDEVFDWWEGLKSCADEHKLDYQVLIPFRAKAMLTKFREILIDTNFRKLLIDVALLEGEGR